jgi:hypothetical protein
MTAQEVLALRLALCGNGYTPLPLFGKEPPVYGKNNKHKGLERWQLLSNVTREMLEMWGTSWPTACNTGILTALTPALDLDILNEPAVIAVENMVRERFEERGYILVRIGLPPKRAILFRTLDTFHKILVNFTETRGKPEKIELLCNGQQLVADGIHPDTGKPYRWFGGTPWEISHDDLPYISKEEAQQLVNDIAEMLCRDFGYTRKTDRPKRVRRKGNGNDQLANEADWQYLYDNILKGDALHDSLRDLAAKLIASGTSPGAAVNQLRALMEASHGPHDERWNARFDDIPRLVDSAVEKYQTPQPQAGPASPPSLPPPPPPPPSTQPSPGPQPGGPQATAGPIEDTLKIFREWLLLDSDIPVLAMLGTVAANMLPGAPVWLGLIAPPSSAKTELLSTLVKIPHVEMVGTVSQAALLSGTPRQQQAAGARGGLLRKIGAFGFLVLKDFGSTLSMRADDRGQLLAALREIYDGNWTRHVGADGGKTLHWSGKIGLLFGCTRVLDDFYHAMEALGERFLFCRMTPSKKQFRHAIRQIGSSSAQMRQQLTEAVANLFAAPLPPPKKISPEEIDQFDEILDLAIPLRGGTKRDRYTRELEYTYGAEGPARLGLTLERLFAGLDSLGVERATAFAVIKTIAFDSVPPTRLSVYRHLQNIAPNWADTATVANAIRLPTTTARRTLEELVSYDLVERSRQGQGKADIWRVI